MRNRVRDDQTREVGQVRENGGENIYITSVAQIKCLQVGAALKGGSKHGHLTVAYVHFGNGDTAERLNRLWHDEIQQKKKACVILRTGNVANSSPFVGDTAPVAAGCGNGDDIRGCHQLQDDVRDWVWKLEYERYGGFHLRGTQAHA